MPVFFKGTSGSGNTGIDNLINSYIVSADGNINAGDLCEFVNGSQVKRTGVNESLAAKTLQGVVASNKYKAMFIGTTKVAIMAVGQAIAVPYFAIIDCIDNTRLKVLNNAKLADLSEQCFDCNMSKVDDNTFLFVYTNSDNGNIFGRVVTVDSSNNIVLGTKTQIISTYTVGVHMTDKIGTNRFVLFYTEGSGGTAKSAAICLKVIAGALSFGSVYNDATIANASYSDLSVVSEGSIAYVIVAYRNNTNYFLNVRVLSINDTAITFGYNYVLNSNQTSDVSIAKISTNKFIITYMKYDSATAPYWTLWSVVVNTVTNDTSISSGALYVIRNEYAISARVKRIDDTHAVVAFLIGSLNYMCVLSITGTYVEPQIPTAQLYFGYHDLLQFAGDEKKFMLVFCNNANVTTCGIVFRFSDLYLTPTFRTITNQVPKVIAIADTIPSNTGKFGVDGLVELNEDVLTPGSYQYCDENGLMTTVKTNFEIGISISQKELLLKSFWSRGV